MEIQFHIILLASLTSLCAQEPLGEALKELNAVRAERKETLQAIVAVHEQHLAEGVGSMKDLIEAKLQLLTYQRKCNSSSAGKIPYQEEIVELETQRHSVVKEHLKADHGSQLDYLRSNERLLGEKQLLLRLKAEVAYQQSLKQSREQK